MLLWKEKLCCRHHLHIVVIYSHCRYYTHRQSTLVASQVTIIQVIVFLTSVKERWSFFIAIHLFFPSMLSLQTRYYPVVKLCSLFFVLCRSLHAFKWVKYEGTSSYLGFRPGMVSCPCRLVILKYTGTGLVTGSSSLP